VIKVNLLESVTDRPTGVAFVEDKVSSTRTQTFLLALTVVALLVLGIGYDYVSANAQHQAATKELEKQRRINDQMNSVKREQADLEKKIADINFRIDAIQKLRGSQQGPGEVLAEIKARFGLSTGRDECGFVPLHYEPIDRSIVAQSVAKIVASEITFKFRSGMAVGYPLTIASSFVEGGRRQVYWDVTSPVLKYEGAFGAAHSMRKQPHE